MLDPQRTTIAKLKEAYELNEQEAEQLLNALYPGAVYLFDVWRQSFAKWGMDWKFGKKQEGEAENPQFPYVPEKFCPTRIFAIQLVASLFDPARLCNISPLEEGFDAVILATYDDSPFPFQAEKEALFRLMRKETKEFHRQKHTENAWRLTHHFSTEYDFIHQMFPDTIVVDKAAAVRHLYTCGYSLRHEVKGLSRALVEQITASNNEQPAENPKTAIAVPAALWDGKTNPAVRDALRESNYSDPVVAYVLYEWCGLTNKTQIGMLLGPVGALPDSTSLRRANRLLAEADKLTIRKA